MHLLGVFFSRCKKYNDFLGEPLTVWVFLICFNSVKSLVFINILQMFSHFHIFVFLAQIRHTYPHINRLQIKKKSKSSFYSLFFNFCFSVFSVFFFLNKINSTEHKHLQILIPEFLFYCILTALAT